MAVHIKEIITLAQQLHAFLSSGHQSSKEIGTPVRQAIQEIIAEYPPEQEPPLRASSSRRSAELERESFPHDWAITRSSFRTALKKFQTYIQSQSSSPDPEGITRSAPTGSGTSPEQESQRSQSRSTTESTEDIPRAGMATEPLSAADVRKIVADGLAEALQTLRANAGNGNGQAGGNNAEGGNNPGNQNNRDGDFSDTKWRPGDIGYFDPDLDPAQGEGDCVTVGTNVYWRNVFLFTDQVKDNA